VPGLTLIRRRYRELVALAAAAVALSVSLLTSGTIPAIDGFFYDLSLAAYRARPGNRGDPVAVIVVDHDSLDSAELTPIPRVLFGPVWAKLMDGLFAADARTVGFDIIFSYSAGRFPALARDYDLSFLNALARYHDRIVVARSAGGLPSAEVSGAVFAEDTDGDRDEPAAIAYAEMMPDADGVQRLARSTLQSGDKKLPTLAAALLERAKGPAMPKSFLLAPDAALEAVPAYSLIAVLRCLDRDPAAVRAAFAGRIVLVGSNLPEEDRKRAPDRFMRPAERGPGIAGAAGCSLPLVGASNPKSGSIAGVFLQAAAVRAVIDGDIVRLEPLAARAVTATTAGLVGSALGLVLSPWLAAVAVLAVVVGCFLAATALIPFGYWMPEAIPIAAAVTAMVAAYLARFLAEERRRRRVQRAFSHYLAPSIVDQLAESEQELRLGGELREVTVMFADLSGFTALSGKVAPEILTEVTNRYLGVMVEAVEATGGYIDKFIGDAVMAIWGAPAAAPDHADSAARGASRVRDAVMAARVADDARGLPGYSIKIGLNTGPAVVGNVGAPHRYNYTAIGETVNIAARLESVPVDYGCRIVAGPATAAALADRFVLCELDWIRVKGKVEAIAVYQLLAERAAADMAELAYPGEYDMALELYRAGDFAAAEALWRAMPYPHPDAALPPPPLVMAARCAELRAAPPADWDGVFVRSTK